jgi:hypothetical protein
MARRSLQQIVRTEDIYSTEDIIAIKINEAFIDSMFTQSQTANVILSKMGIFKNNMICNKCNSDQPMSYTKRKDSPEGFHWKYKRPCTHSCSLKKGSFLKILNYP